MRNHLKKIKRESIKNELTAAFEIPREVVFDMPLISLKGKEEAVIENYKGIIEYSTEKIRINTSSGVVKLTGDGMLIKCLDSENIIISGKINSMEFL